MKKLKLFVWENVLNDYTSGIMFALAYDVDHAKKIILRDAQKKFGYKSDSVSIDLQGGYRMVTKPEGFALFGGG